MDRASLEDGAAVRAAGSQKAKTVRKQRIIIRIMVLNRPTISARRPGAHLPKKEPVFRIARSWYARAGRILADKANEVRYVRGTKRPHSTRNIAMVMTRKVVSLNIRRSGMKACFEIERLGRSERISAFAIDSRSRKSKPSARVAQSKPVRMKRDVSIKGKMMPGPY